MRITTDNLNDVTITTEADGTESIIITNAHGRVEVTLPAWGDATGLVVTEVFRSICQTQVGAIHTRLRDHFDNPNCCGAHNTEVVS